MSRMFAISSQAGCFALALCLVISAGCDSTSSTSSGTAGLSGDGSRTKPASTLAGDIQIEGSSTVQPISNAIAELFNEEHPAVNITVTGQGTGNGFQSFYGKESDISDASRPIKPGEFEECKTAGVTFVELPVAYDGLTIVIHPDNDWVKQLTVDQLKQIFVEGAKSWKDVDASWPDEEIKIFAPGTGSGTYDYFHEVLAKKDDKELRDDMSLNEDDNILVQGVAGNVYSIGFFGVAYYEENKDKLQAVPVVNPKDDQAYLPTTENIASNKYAPFSRPLFIYVNTESLNRAEVQTFVNFYMDKVSDACEQVGYVRLPDEIIESGRANLENLTTGTHFVTSEGESRSGPLADNFKPDNLTE